jgi:hypothetical protein
MQMMHVIGTLWRTLTVLEDARAPLLFTKK